MITLNKKAIVTGATGFVGSQLCLRLVELGWDVSVIIRPNSDISPIQSVQNEVNIYQYEGQSDQLIHYFQQQQVDVVFHLASLFISEHEVDQISSLLTSNLLFGTEILEAMRHSNTPLLINTGTSWQHYHTDSYNPVNLYAATKEAFEKLLQYYVEAEGIRAVTLKLFDTYGENDNRPKLINLLHQLAKEQKELSMSPGKQIIDLVHISDVVQAFIQAVDYLEENQDITYATFGVGTGKPIQLRNLITLFEQLTGEQLNIQWGGRPYRKREVMQPWTTYDVLPNWECQISLEDGLLKYKK